MVRTYKAKTDRGSIDEERMKTAITEVVSKRLSIRKAADKYSIKAGTLQHRIEKFLKTVDENEASASNVYSSKYTVAQVFSNVQEKALTEYLLNCSKMHYGLTLQQLLTLAYEYAVYLGCKFPESWNKNKCAGKDWAIAFRKRNEKLSLRKPENTSAARSFAFNKTAVAEFFDNYERILTRYNLSPDRIINLDETGVNTVLPTPRVLAEKKQRQVGQIVSGERGENVTLCGIITATGTALPPVYVFPRVHFKEHFLTGAPAGSLGLANRSGWMTAELHIQVLKHIQRHTSSSKENPILIICDNHESHISIEAVNFCRDNGIVYLSLPPHTSHKLQPLDVGVFGPFKSKLKIAFNDWHVRNVGKTLSIYNIAGLTKSAFLESFTPKNITSGFSKPGICPLNRLAFGDDDFAPIEIYAASSQDARENTQNEVDLVESEINDDMDDSREDETSVGANIIGNRSKVVSSPNVILPSNAVPSGSTLILSPESVRPYPKKAIGEKAVKKGREKGKSRVFTDTPEKDRLQILHEEKERKQQIKIMKQRAKYLKTAKNLLECTETEKKKKKRKVWRSEIESDSDSSQELEVPSDSEEENFDPLDPENI